MNLELIVRTYMMNIRPRVQFELDCFRQKTLSSAVEFAAMATNSEGKRYSHQRRLKKTNLEKAKHTLIANINKIEKCVHFDELFSLVEKLLLPIKGIGELYVYDTTLRIGANLNLLPTKIYLHAGTRTGAKAIGFQGTEKALEASEFPPELQQLKPLEIEDVLCIFKNELGKMDVPSFGNDIEKRSWCC